MTQQCYYIGIDMDDRNAVISYYKAGMREPETLSTIAGSEIYQIPVALIKKRGIGQWFIGEEAKKMALISSDLPRENSATKATMTLSLRT